MKSHPAPDQPITLANGAAKVEQTSLVEHPSLLSIAKDGLGHRLGRTATGAVVRSTIRAQHRPFTAVRPKR